MISAKVIKHSINEQDIGLASFGLRYPKFIHGEFMTHRVLSRNASSSRAIPTEKLIEEVRSDARRAAPVFWGKNQKGMQAVEELEGNNKLHVQMAWNAAALNASIIAEDMMKMEAHKQIVNRLLEPFSHINVVASATEWDNFFGLRLDKAAQPEMRALAEAMWAAINESEPVRMKPNTNWHLPFFEMEDWENLHMWAHNQGEETYNKFMVDGGLYSGSFGKDLAIKVSVARCARVSYQSFETGKRSTVAEDLILYDRLLSAQPLHASPAEHQATPDEQIGRNGIYEWCNKEEWGNFRGWRQYRKMLAGESCAPLPDGYKKAPHRG